MIPILALAALFGGLHLLTRDGAGSVGAPPELTPEAIAALSEMRGDVRHFRPALAAQILASLGGFGVEPVQLGPDANGRPQAPPGMLLRLVPLAASSGAAIAENPVSARDAALMAQARGCAVLATLSVAIVADPAAPKLLLFVPPQHRVLARSASAWGVLVDAPPAPAPAAEVVPAAPPEQPPPAAAAIDPPPPATSAPRRSANGKPKPEARSAEPPAPPGDVIA